MKKNSEFLTKPDLPSEEAQRRGALLAEVFCLRKVRVSGRRGRFVTTWGDKTALGVYETAKRLVLEGQ